MKKKINRRKLIVIVGAAALAIILIIGLTLGIKAIKNKNSDDVDGVKHATRATLKVLKEEAEKVEKASEEFFTLEKYSKYKYPTGKVITIEVNDYGKLIVTCEQFDTATFNELVEYSGVNIGADIGLTDVVYSIRFDENNKIQMVEGDSNNPDTLLKEFEYVSTTKSSIKPINEADFKNYANTFLSSLKKYVNSNNITLKYGSILLYIDNDGYLKLLFLSLGISEEQVAEFTEIVKESIPLDEFVGYCSYAYKIDADDGVYNLVKYDMGV